MDKNKFFPCLRARGFVRGETQRVTLVPWDLATLKGDKTHKPLFSRGIKPKESEVLGVIGIFLVNKYAFRLHIFSENCNDRCLAIMLVLTELQVLKN
ncbi:MAG: hypothetical protein DSM106950_34680 [Stigonema ocellatum SAG 48.90 = DSM 106950]|nr:hypothetical protein [Stigonema ocellatum SAG 48.90 = DSM 106950]